MYYQGKARHGYRSMVESWRMVECTNVFSVWVPLASLVIQVLLFSCLVVYTIETFKIRLASQEQIETSHQPFVAFSCTARDFEAAVLEMGGAVGAMMVLCPEGTAQIENVGTGPAINIRYSMTPVDPESTRARPNGYLVGLRPGDSFRLPVPRNILHGREWQCVFTYESLGKRRYQTTAHLNGLVLTDICFDPLPPTN